MNFSLFGAVTAFLLYFVGSVIFSLLYSPEECLNGTFIDFMGHTYPCYSMDKERSFLLNPSLHDQGMRYVSDVEELIDFNNAESTWALLEVNFEKVIGGKESSSGQEMINSMLDEDLILTLPAEQSTKSLNKTQCMDKIVNFLGPAYGNSSRLVGKCLLIDRKPANLLTLSRAEI